MILLLGSRARMKQWIDMEFRHIARAACTPELTEVLLHFNFFDILKNNDRWERSLRYMPGFINWLCENVGPFKVVSER